MIDLLQVFLLSMTPIGELRLSIPMGIVVYNLNVVPVFFVSILGNLVPAIFLLFFLKKISSYLSKKSIFFQKLFTWWENNAKKKHLDGVQKLGLVGLFLFVAIPLPLTGAWTGSLLATIMNLPIKKSLPSIFFGIVTAGIIVTFTIIFGINIERYLGWQILIGLVIISVLAYLYFKKTRKS